MHIAIRQLTCYPAVCLTTIQFTLDAVFLALDVCNRNYSPLCEIYECRFSCRQRFAEVRSRTHQSTARQTALAWRSRAGAVQAVCNSPPMSAAQSITVHDRLLRLHLRHRSSAAPTVRRLPSAACAATPPFDVWSSGLFFARPGGLELVTRLPSRSDAFYWQFSPWPEISSFLVLLAFPAH